MAQVDTVAPATEDDVESTTWRNRADTVDPVEAGGADLTYSSPEVIQKS